MHNHLRISCFSMVKWKVKYCYLVTHVRCNRLVLIKLSTKTNLWKVHYNRSSFLREKSQCYSHIISENIFHFDINLHLREFPMLHHKDNNDGITELHFEAKRNAWPIRFEHCNWRKIWNRGSMTMSLGTSYLSYCHFSLRHYNLIWHVIMPILQSCVCDRIACATVHISVVINMLVRCSFVLASHIGEDRMWLGKRHLRSTVYFCHLKIITSAGKLLHRLRALHLTTVVAYLHNPWPVTIRCAPAALRGRRPCSELL